MVRRRHAATAFRPSAPAGPASAPSRRQTAALLAGVLVVAGGIAVASFAVKPNTARSFDLYYGSVFIDDTYAPVAIDLSSGKPTVRITNPATAVSAKQTENIHVVPLEGGTLMLDTTTGEFNMLDAGGFVVKTEGGGVAFKRDAPTLAVASGDSAFLVRPGVPAASGKPAVPASVFLVGQSTVATATDGEGPKTRASANLADAISDPIAKLENGSGSGSDSGFDSESHDMVASANGQLWALVGTGDTRRITQLVVPAGSNAGVTFAVHGRGTVSGTSAIESATERSDGTGADIVGVASADQVRVFGTGGTSRTVPVGIDGDVTGIRPVAQARGELTYLYETSTAWNLVNVPVNGTRASVATIEALSPAQPLITPAASDGKVFALAGTAGTLLQIDRDGKTSNILPKYPFDPHTDKLSLTGAQVTAVGSRVIFNAPVARSAVVFFADGSHDLRIVDKHSAVQLSTSGDAAFTGPDQQKPDDTPPDQKPPKDDTAPETAVNNKINCKTVSQKPHIPVLSTGVVGAESVELKWTYPLIETQDCAPSTYVVTVSTNDPDAPPVPELAPVIGQTGTTVSHLFPDTTYYFKITAYIKHKGTSSKTVPATTSPQGPPAPTNVRTAVDNKGNWTISWNSCGGLRKDCVPTLGWQIIPTFCDGAGLSAALEPVRIAGDRTQHSFSHTYAGGEDLLGRGLSFQVQGFGTKATIGDTASDGSCLYSWTPVVADDITISASAPPNTTTQTTSYTDVRVNFAAGQTHDLGGVGGEMTYLLQRGGETVNRVGPTTRPTARLTGVEPGVQYSVSVVVNPARHRDQSARIGPKDVRPAIARWPAVSVTSSFQETSAYRGNLYVTVSMPPGTNTRNETFDLTQNSMVRCSNSVMRLDKTDLRLGQRMSFDVDRTQLNSGAGPCQVVVALSQNARTITEPPLYGDGTTSSTAHTAVTIDSPRLTAGNEDFIASWNSDAPTADPSLVVRYTGGDPLFLQYSSNWYILVTNDGGSTNCASTSNPLTVTNPSVVLPVDKACIRHGGVFTVQISVRYFGQRYSFHFPVNGSAPEPVDPTQMSFTASFSNPLIGRSEVKLEYHSSKYHQSVLDDLSWNYNVSSSITPGVNCLLGNYNPTPNENGGPGLPMSTTKCPKDDGNGNLAVYTLFVHFRDPTYGVTGDYSDIPIDGAPK